MTKPQTTDKINYTLTGCLIYVLRDNDILRETDFIRELVETGGGGEGFETTFKNEKWQGPMWHTVDNDFGARIGNTYKDFMTFVGLKSRQHEIVRIVPDSVKFELEIKGQLPVPGEHINPPKGFKP